MKNKKGLSGIVTMLLVIALAIVAVGVVWYIVQNVLNQSQDEIEQGTADLFGNCVEVGGSVVNETATCDLGEEKKLIGGEYCCIPA